MANKQREQAIPSALRGHPACDIAGDFIEARAVCCDGEACLCHIGTKARACLTCKPDGVACKKQGVEPREMVAAAPSMRQGEEPDPFRSGPLDRMRTTMTSKTLFITGASTGIGAQTARAAVAAGWQVGLFARSESRLAAIVTELGEAALALPGDATSLEDQEQAVAKLVQRFGGIDAAFANAGTGLGTPGILEGDPAEWQAMINLNCMGVLYTARATYPHLKTAKGTLVLTGSAAGRNHITGSIYGATKWFVHGLAGNLASDMRAWGGRCSVIAPGMVDTPFFDDAKPDKLKAEDVADAVMHAITAPDRAAVREIYLQPQF